MLFNGGLENHGDENHGDNGHNSAPCISVDFSIDFIFQHFGERAHLLPPRTREKGDAYTAIQHLMYFLIFYIVG